MSGGIERPHRSGLAYFKDELLNLEREPRSAERPERLSLDNLLVFETLFQPRETSLAFRAGESQKHVETMARVVREGGELDPMAVVAFGSRWLLLDGHHRRAAYLDAEHCKPVPVEVHDSDLHGAERLAWAMALSTALNSKNKLAMSDADKLDSAWRLTVMGAGSKRKVHEATGAANGSIGNMRNTLARLREDGGHSDSELYAMTWSGAMWQRRRLEGDEEQGPHPEAHERKLRSLIRALSPPVDAKGPPAVLLLEALEELRPGVAIELETAIALRRAGESLDI